MTGTLRRGFVTPIPDGAVALTGMTTGVGENVVFRVFYKNREARAEEVRIL